MGSVAAVVTVAEKQSKIEKPWEGAVPPFQGK